MTSNPSLPVHNEQRMAVPADRIVSLALAEFWLVLFLPDSSNRVSK